MWALGVLIVAQAATSTSGAWTERFAGSRAGLEVSTTVATLVPDLWLSYDPTVEVGLVLLPRFALAEDWVVDARWSLGLELTNSATHGPGERAGGVGPERGPELAWAAAAASGWSARSGST
jgi:hypothetical protein